MQVALARPDRLSTTVPVNATWGTVTVAPATGVVMTNVGAVLSIFRVTEALAVFPPASTAVIVRLDVPPAVKVVAEALSTNLAAEPTPTSKELLTPEVSPGRAAVSV